MQKSRWACSHSGNTATHHVRRWDNWVLGSQHITQIWFCCSLIAQHVKTSDAWLDSWVYDNWNNLGSLLSMESKGKLDPCKSTPLLSQWSMSKNHYLTLSLSFYGSSLGWRIVEILARSGVTVPAEVYPLRPFGMALVDRSPRACMQVIGTGIQVLKHVVAQHNMTT